MSATRCGRVLDQETCDMRGLDQETCDMSGTIVESTLTCPHCGRQSLEAMPVDACRFFHECAGCGAMLQPLPGDCCVFCSYGSVPCPPIQQGHACC